MTALELVQKITHFRPELSIYILIAQEQEWISDFYEFIGEHIFRADLSVSVPMLDSLMEPAGVIAEAGYAGWI